MDIRTHGRTWSTRGLEHIYIEQSLLQCLISLHLLQMCTCHSPYSFFKKNKAGSILFPIILILSCSLAFLLCTVICLTRRHPVFLCLFSHSASLSLLSCLISVFSSFSFLLSCPVLSFKREEKPGAGDSHRQLFLFWDFTERMQGVRPAVFSQFLGCKVGRVEADTEQQDHLLRETQRAHQAPAVAVDSLFLPQSGGDSLHCYWRT